MHIARRNGQGADYEWSRGSKRVKKRTSTNNNRLQNVKVTASQWIRLFNLTFVDFFLRENRAHTHPSVIFLCIWFAFVFVFIQKWSWPRIHSHIAHIRCVFCALFESLRSSATIWFANTVMCWCWCVCVCVRASGMGFSKDVLMDTEQGRVEQRKSRGKVNYNVFALVGARRAQIMSVNNEVMVDCERRGAQPSAGWKWKIFFFSLPFFIANMFYDCSVRLLPILFPSCALALATIFLEYT